ncbi:MAG: N-acetyltransferase [Pseudomonadota bacterium]
MVTIAIETSEDRDAVETLFDLSFAPGRELLSSYRLRDGVTPIAPLCLVARDEFDVIVAAIRFWPVEIAPEREVGPPHAALLLGPIAVHPTRQGEGIAAGLIIESLEKAEDLGWRRVLLVGDEPYYRRFGFRRALAEGIEFPPPTNPNRVLAKALVPGAMDGVAGTIAPMPLERVTVKRLTR